MSGQTPCWHSATDLNRVSDVFYRRDLENLALGGQSATQPALPPSLVNLLFGPDDDDPPPDGTPPATYALLDAAKHAFVPELLETSGLTHQCLFMGKAAEDMRDVSPWLVRLEPDNRLTRALFTPREGPGDLCRLNLGPILRCAADFDAVRRHLRKFLRIRRAEADIWVYFRFWESHVLPGLAGAVAAEPLALAQDLLAPIDGAPQTWALFNAEARRATLWSLRDPARIRNTVPLLHPATVEALTHSTLNAQMTSEINMALCAVADDLRRAYGSEPRLADLWSALQTARFDLSEHRIDAIRGYLTMLAHHQQDTAWRILMRPDQGAKVRLWHLERALEDHA